MSQGKAVVGVLVTGVIAAFGATALYPLYVAERKPRPTTAPPVRECRRGKLSTFLLFLRVFL